MPNETRKPVEPPPFPFKKSPDQAIFPKSPPDRAQPGEGKTDEANAGKPAQPSAGELRQMADTMPGEGPGDD